jgi:hypothetical protein
LLFNAWARWRCTHQQRPRASHYQRQEPSSQRP